MKRLCDSYKVFCKRMLEIQGYINNTFAKNEVLSSLEGRIETEQEKQFIEYLKNLSKSQIQYNAIIISLYGCFENYVDDLLSNYLSVVFENRKKYDDLPKNLRDKYRLKVGEYLSNPQRFKSWDVEIIDVVHHYGDVLSSNFPASIEKRLLYSHSANLHFDELINLFGSIGIDNSLEKICSSYELKDYFINDLGVDESDFQLKIKRAKSGNYQTDLFEPLEVLVSQRNIVAHSWNDIGRVDERYINNRIVGFLKCLALSILEICLLELFPIVDHHENCFEDEDPIDVYDNHILCINNQRKRICRGDLIIYSSNNTIKCSKIKNIQQDCIDIESVDENSAVDIGMSLTGKIKITDKICSVINL